jgi:hypothetical protein
VTTTHSQLAAEPDNALEPTALTDAEVYATIDSWVTSARSVRRGPGGADEAVRRAAS